MRADLLLVARGLAPSRTAARRAIEAGRVQALRAGAWQGVRQPAQDLPENIDLEVTYDPDERFVSRGGLKLAGALAHTGLVASDAVCLDVGQSTGGFSDCLVQAGAARVVGVEVGHGQLHARLRDDARIVCLEGINARALTPVDLGGHLPVTGFDLIVCDASFISLTLLLPCWPALLAKTGAVLTLVKPQFEVGPGKLGKGGIVRDTSLYPGVEARIRDACASADLTVRDFFPSCIVGGDGNHEFFIYARR